MAKASTSRQSPFGASEPRQPRAKAAAQAKGGSGPHRQAPSKPATPEAKAVAGTKRKACSQTEGVEGKTAGKGANEPAQSLEGPVELEEPSRKQAFCTAPGRSVSVS